MSDMPPPADWDLLLPPDDNDAPPHWDDEPPLDWDAPSLEALGILDTLPPDSRADLEAELRELDGRIENQSSEMNTPDGSLRLDDLLEEQAALQEELFTLGNATSVQLVDARFLGKPDLDAEGQVTGYTVQCIELSQDLNGEPSGRVLDVGHYQALEQAEFEYQTLQESIQSGELPIEAVSEMGEALAEANGLSGTAWREISAEDLERYDWHVQELDNAARDLPSPELSPDQGFNRNVFAAALGDPETAAREQERLETEQARLAMRSVGLEPPADFDLKRDSFLDQATGDRLINGVFQQDLNDPTQNCRAVFVALSSGEEGIGLKAAAVEFGEVGSFEQACANRELVQEALENNGPAQAVHVIDDIQEHLQPTLAAEPALETNTTWEIS